MRSNWTVVAVAWMTAVLGCTDSQLYDQRQDTSLPSDRTVSFQGQFCTLGVNDVVRPIKIFFAMDGSGSMAKTDPNCSRCTAIINLFNSLPADPDIYVALMVFAGATNSFLTPASCTGSGTTLEGFTQLINMDDCARDKMAAQLQTWEDPANDPNSGSTDFVKPLSEIYAVINQDIANYESQATDPSTATRADYYVIFLSDGHPDQYQDDQLLPEYGGTAVTRIYDLKDLADNVTFNTVHVFNPIQPLYTPCNFDAGPAGSFADGGYVPTCQTLIVNQDAERLQLMAEAGGGVFRDFRNNEPINFLYLNFGQVKRSWVVSEFLVSNFSALPDSPIDDADSDSDGLPDSLELQIGTDPLNADTDGVEYKFGADAGLNPLVPNIGCPPALLHVDSDCDGIWDCDEQIIGSNPQVVDTDYDGVPDKVEWLLGTQASSPDMEEDPDQDLLVNRKEVEFHTNPLQPDTSTLTDNAYRYTVSLAGVPNAQGQQCYNFEVDNVLLANTLPDTENYSVLPPGWVPRTPTGRGPGYNDLWISVTFVPMDDPTAHTEVRQYRIQTPRFPVGGIRSPVDGVIPIVPANFVDSCQAPGQVTTGP
jgi:hypothetical protein